MVLPDLTSESVMTHESQNLDAGSYDRIGDSGSGSDPRTFSNAGLAFERHHRIERHVLLYRYIQVHVGSFGVDECDPGGHEIQIFLPAQRARQLRQFASRVDIHATPPKFSCSTVSTLSPVRR